MIPGDGTTLRTGRDYRRDIAIRLPLRQYEFSGDMLQIGGKVMQDGLYGSGKGGCLRSRRLGLCRNNDQGKGHKS